ncbi:MAG: transmembrane 220 family protein [Pseudomonadota bacterium]
MAFQIANSIFLLAYVLSAGVQLNDPDALPWIAIYLTAAGLCLDQFIGPRLTWLPPALLALCLVWLLFLLPAIIGQVSPSEVFESVSMQTRAVEEAREIGGLAMVALWAGIVMVRRGRSHSTH